MNDDRDFYDRKSDAYGAYPEGRVYPGDTAFPGADAYGGDTAFPGADAYPEDSAFAGDTAFPGADAYPEDSAFAGDTAFPGADAYPEDSAFAGADAYGGDTAFPGADAYPEDSAFAGTGTFPAGYVSAGSGTYPEGGAYPKREENLPRREGTEKKAGEGAYTGLKNPPPAAPQPEDDGKKKKLAILLSLLLTVAIAGILLVILLLPKKKKNTETTTETASSETQELQSEQTAASKIELNTEAKKSETLSKEEIAKLSNESYNSYLTDITSKAKETGPFYVKAADPEDGQDTYFCCYTMADMDGDGINEMMLYTERWTDGFRMGTEKESEYRFYEYDVDADKLEETGACRVKAEDWKNLREACPLEFRNNGIVFMDKTGTVFAGIRNGWMYDIGFLSDEAGAANNFGKEKFFFDGCLAKLSDNGNETVDATILNKDDGLNYSFSLGKSQASEIENKAKAGTIILPEITSFGKKLDKQLTKEQAEKAVLNYCLKKTEGLLEDIKKGYGISWKAGEPENGEIVVDASTFEGNHTYYHVGIEYGDVTIYEKKSGSTENPVKKEESFIASDYLYESEFEKAGMKNWQAAYARLIRGFQDPLPNKDTLGGIEGYLYDFNQDGVPEIVLNVSNDPNGGDRRAYTFMDNEVKELSLKPSLIVGNEYCGTNTMVTMSLLSMNAGCDVKVAFFGMQGSTFSEVRSYTITGNSSENGAPTPKITFSSEGAERGASMAELQSDLAQYGLEIEQTIGEKIAEYKLVNKENRLIGVEWKKFDDLLTAIWAN